MKTDIPFSVIFFIILLIQDTLAHSWIACTDYTVKNDDFYDPGRCRGYPRAANRYLKKNIPFGKDSGFDHQPTENHPCKTRRNDKANYDSEYPMAVYYPGQQVVLAHPMKEHGADAECTNRFIPDTGNWIYRGETNMKTDPTLSEFRQKLVVDLGVSPFAENNWQSSTYPKPGFQNAPQFCLDTDKSLGTYSFNVPLHLRPGIYTFMWLWAFNNMDDLFSTCFEVQIVRDQIVRNEIHLSKGITDLSEPCGGATSNFLVEGVCNNLVMHIEDPGGHAAVFRVCWTALMAMIVVAWIIS